MHTLNDLAPGERGIITAVTAEGELKRRLMDMGIIAGVPICLVKHAPLGDPLQIRVQNTLIALRRTEAATISVKPQEHPHHAHHRTRRRACR